MKITEQQKKAIFAEMQKAEALKKENERKEELSAAQAELNDFLIAWGNKYNVTLAPQMIILSK